MRMLICDFVLGLSGALEIYTRDAAAVCVEHSEEVDLDMPNMKSKPEQMVLKILSLSADGELLQSSANERPLV